MHLALLSFFKEVLTSQGDYKAQVDAFAGDVFFTEENNCLVFSLTDLHQFLPAVNCLSFKEFKHLLYQGEFNASLQKLGGKVEMYKSTGKLETNLYKLIAIPKKPQ